MSETSVPGPLVPDVDDGYDLYYTERLWQLLPAVQRTTDTDQYGVNGPLRELVARIGAQVAVVRRSIDRMWADQSVETCDDWVIPYIGDLLGVNLVPGLDAAGQRRDVAKTIHYRRRKGTPAVLEELAADVTSWQARVVEAFRRLGRTTHRLDVPGLVGPLTGTPPGGFADLRSAHGAGLTGTAFDEYSRTADVRTAHGTIGWYGIPKLLVFLWRLTSFTVTAGTPVPVSGCPNQYAFDPTGRQIPLFLRPRDPVDVDDWIPAHDWEVPGPLTTSLLRLGVDLSSSYGVDAPGATIGTVWPELGRVQLAAAPSTPPTVSYTYGFADTIGAGPYDRDLVRDRPTMAGTPVTLANAASLAGALVTAGADGTVTITDSLTYTPSAAVGPAPPPFETLLVQAEPGASVRPVVRLAAGSTWNFDAVPTPPSAATPTPALPPPPTLALDGLLISGGDVVLTGSFTTVRITACTLDPGTAGAVPASFATSVDGRSLSPTRLSIAGTVQELVVDHCVMGPIRTTGNGRLESLTVSDSIIQGLAEDALTLPDAAVDLVRVTVLGPFAVHKLTASDCVLDEVVTVDDTQYGCVRFSAWAAGSVVPRQYESVQVPTGAPLFTSRAYGDPGYGQLADEAGTPVAQGAENGSEMGAFCSFLAPVKERGLLLKYAEYMPLGLTPVLVHVT